MVSSASPILVGGKQGATGGKILLTERSKVGGGRQRRTENASACSTIGGKDTKLKGREPTSFGIRIASLNYEKKERGGA